MKQIKSYLERACSQAVVRLSKEKLPGYLEWIIIETKDLDELRNEFGCLFENEKTYSVIPIFQEDSDNPMGMDELRSIRGYIEEHPGNTIEQFSIISESGNHFGLCVLYWEKGKVNDD